jgi:hypothetical protein
MEDCQRGEREGEHTEDRRIERRWWDRAARWPFVGQRV